MQGKKKDMALYCSQFIFNFLILVNFEMHACIVNVV